MNFSPQRLFRLVFIMVGAALIGSVIKAANAAPLEADPVVVVAAPITPAAVVLPPIAQQIKLEPAPSAPAILAVEVSIPIEKTTPTSVPHKNGGIGTVQIPKIGVDARVLSMGLEPGGKMAVPDNFVDIGWWNGGAIPGDIGTAVFGAHVDNGGSTPGVFKHLSSLSTGDTFTFTREDGEVATFRVSEVRVYDRNESNTKEVFTSADEKAHLNLITCHGEWLPAENTYASRLIVFTERI